MQNIPRAYEARWRALAPVMGRSWEYESVYFCLSSVWSMNLRAFKNFVFVYFKCLGVIVLYSRLINPEFSIYGCQVYWKIICVYSTRINYIYITCVCINYILIICIINCCRIKQLVQSQYELGASGFFFKETEGYLFKNILSISHQLTIHIHSKWK